MEPMLLEPYYRHGAETPWGGDAFARLFGRDLPDDRTGESLEISALSNTSSRIAGGEWSGATLFEAAEALGSRLTGTDGPFPLMAKWIDARDMLSVQAHPGDGYARARHGKKGKTEAWLVLAAKPGARLCYGLKEGCPPFGELCADEGALLSALRFVPAVPGDVLYIPHGLVHALGEGIVVYEIQQSSDVTYRLYDWGRIGADGKPRQTHIEDALHVVRPGLRPDKSPGARLSLPDGEATVYVCDENFELARVEVAGETPLPGGRMLLITALGECALRWEGGLLALRFGQSCLVPAESGRVSLKGRAGALLSALPDPRALRAALGGRASLVSGLEG